MLAIKGRFLSAEGGNIAFSDEGSFTNFTGCHSFNNVTDMDAGAASLSTQQVSGNNFGNSFVALVHSLTDNPVVEARGVNANIDLILRTKGTGRLRFGVRTASADVPVTGYVEIIDAAGTLRRLAVVG